ncbi:MAG TPA: DUF2846 domain-containing protein [Polyangia bacterium]|nr:DUF2846 domain-containing protein [Polyangia bacterium]
MQRSVVAALVVSLALSAVGCATVPMAAAADDARMKQRQPGPESALIYVYRNEVIGYSVHMDVDLDGRPWGATVAKSFMVWEVPPGRHTLVSHAENDTLLVLDTLPGQRYFVWQEVKMGILYARSALQLVPDAVGATGVGECRLVSMPLPPPRAAPPPPPPVPAPPTS